MGYKAHKPGDILKIEGDYSSPSIQEDLFRQTMRTWNKTQAKHATVNVKNKIGDDNMLRMPIKNFAVTKYNYLRSVFLKMRNSDNEKLKMLLTIKLKESRLPIYKICKTLKIDQSNFYSYLNGKIKNPGIHVLFKISKFKPFNLNFTELLNLGGYEVLQIKAYKEFVSFLRKIAPTKSFSEICWYVKGAELLNKIISPEKISDFYNFQDIKNNLKTYSLENYQLTISRVNKIISGVYRYLVFLFINGKVRFLPNFARWLLNKHSIFKISNGENRRILKKYKKFLLAKGYDPKYVGPQLIIAFLFLCARPPDPFPLTLNKLAEVVKNSLGPGWWKVNRLYDFFEFFYGEKIKSEIEEKRIFEKMFSGLSKKSQAIVRIFLRNFGEAERPRIARILRLFFEINKLREVKDISEESIFNFRGKLEELEYHENAVEENLEIIRKLTETRKHLKSKGGG